jgi:preprotein translocase subunit YajC
MESNAAIQTVLYIGVLGAVFYMLIIRPQQKQRKEHDALVDALVVGDRVVTAGGIHGTVKAVTEDTVDLEVSPGIVLTFVRAAVQQKAEE